MIDPVPDTVYPIVFRLQIPVQGPGFAAGVELFVETAPANNPRPSELVLAGLPEAA